MRKYLIERFVLLSELTLILIAFFVTFEYNWPLPPFYNRIISAMLLESQLITQEPYYMTNIRNYQMVIQFSNDALSLIDIGIIVSIMAGNE